MGGEVLLCISNIKQETSSTVGRMGERVGDFNWERMFLCQNKKKREKKTKKVLYRIYISSSYATCNLWIT